MCCQSEYKSKHFKNSTEEILFAIKEYYSTSKQKEILIYAIMHMILEDSMLS